MPTTKELFGGHMMSPVPDPYSVYRRLRADMPIMAVEGPLGVHHTVSRYDNAFTVLKNGKLFSSRANARGIGMVMGRTILEMEGRDHARHRNIIAPFFMGKALKGELQESVASFAHELIDRFAGEGRADLVQQFTFTYPMRVMTHIIGVPVDDYHQFHEWALDIISISDNPMKAFASVQAVVDYLRPVMEQRRAEPTNDLLSRLMHAEVEGQRLEDEEILGFLRLLLPAGAETTYRLTGSALFALLAHPEVYDEVRADRGKIDLLIEETLRWESPVQYCAREVTETTSLSGIELPAGTQLQIALGSANRDERHYRDPDRFDLHRKNTDHVAFGFGEHFCPGSHLARMEARVALNALLDRLPNLRLDPAEPCRVVGLAFRSPDKLPVRFG